MRTPSLFKLETKQFVFGPLEKATTRLPNVQHNAPYDQGGFTIIDYDNMVKALRLSWLKRIVDPDYFGFWKSYLDHLLVNKGGYF